MLKKPQRIKKNKEFLNLYKKGSFQRSRLFLLKFIKNNLKNSRFAFVVSLKVSKRAVDRNLIKRRMREIIRILNKDIKEGYDLVFIMNSLSLNVTYKDLQNEVVKSLKKTKLLKKTSSL